MKMEMFWLVSDVVDMCFVCCMHRINPYLLIVSKLCCHSIEYDASGPRVSMDEGWPRKAREDTKVTER